MAALCWFCWVTINASIPSGPRGLLIITHLGFPNYHFEIASRTCYYIPGVRTCGQGLTFLFTLQAELRRTVELRSIIQNLKSLNATAADIKADAQSRSEFTIFFYSFLCFECVTAVTGIINFVTCTPPCFSRADAG